VFIGKILIPHFDDELCDRQIHEKEQAERDDTPALGRGIIQPANDLFPHATPSL
jgi:hypothetical protein